MRVFFAIALSDSVREIVRQAVEDIHIPYRPWRWIPASNLHLTLKFLGETPEGRVPALHECAETACQGVAAFSIRLGRLGGFPNLSRPRVLFYRIEDGVEPLVALARRLDEVLSDSLGVPREKRPFRAHATIARVKKELAPMAIETLRSVPPLAGATQRVEKLLLMRSELHPKGAKYYHLKEFALEKSK